MRTPGTVARTKVTLSLPRSLVQYADEKAQREKCSRSQVVADLLEKMKSREEEELAAEGYHYYARESTEFARYSLKAVSEVLDGAG